MRIKTKILLGALFLSTSVSAYDWESDLQHRLQYDFTESRESVVDYIRRYIPHVTEEKIAQWETSGALENMEIDGQKRYFRYAARNLFRIDPSCQRIWDKANPSSLSARSIACMRNTPQIIRDAPFAENHIAQARRFRVTYSLTVDPDVVPAGQTIRCWLPFPRRDTPRQTDVELLSASEEKYVMAPEKALHSTIYMEHTAQQGEPTKFQIQFEFTAHGEWHELSMPDAYDKKSKLYKTYTAERKDHIIFTPELRALADSLTQGLENPVEKARAIFTYIDENFPWASSREYSTIENIPMYVFKNRHGDCGQKTLLLLTLCRICGIPAQWESGFQVPPGGVNLHDWGKLYFEGYGWVPVDQSYGISHYARTEQDRMFYLGGIDSWRMIVNSDYGQPLVPKKKYPRSETVDFQRGEVEWKGGNIYFDQWDWDIDVEYID